MTKLAPMTKLDRALAWIAVALAGIEIIILAQFFK